MHGHTNIKHNVDVKSTGCKRADSSKVTYDSINAAGIANTGMNNSTPYVARKFWTKRTTITVTTQPCLLKCTPLNSVIAAHLIHMKDATLRDLTLWPWKWTFK